MKHRGNSKNTRLQDERTHEPEGTNNSSGRTHKYQKTQDHRGRSESTSKKSNTWWRKIREAVEIRTHKPEMKRDNGYDLPVIYNNLLQ